nr:ORF1ab [Goose astrovirus]
MPDYIDIIGFIPVDKLVVRAKTIHDPLLNLVEHWQQDEYAPTKWDYKAYTKMFEKFFYHEPQDFVNNFPELVILSDSVVLEEHSYMANSNLTPIMATKKNVDSTPGYPKFKYFDTEKDYLEQCGWGEYLKAVSDIDETVQNRPLWWCFLKNEVLKKKKIMDNDIRMILCADPVYTRIGAMFEQDQNEKMKQQTERRAAQVGWTPFFGGIHQRVSRLIGGGDRFFVETDWTRYDGTLPKPLFWRIRQMRYFFLSNHHKTPQLKKLYDWYVKNLVEKIILLPTGEVCTVKKGNPSGQYSTTVDNNMCNVWLTHFEIAYLYWKQHGSLPTLRLLRDNITMICYGDDRLVSIRKGFINYDTNVVIDMYKNIFGMWVKPENVKVSDDIEGMTFCGLTLVKRSDGRFVGVPNVDKILSTLENPVRKLPNLESLWGKLVSLRILCENAPNSVREFLDKQINTVEEHAASENINLPEVGPDFFSQIW